MDVDDASPLLLDHARQYELREPDCGQSVLLKRLPKHIHVSVREDGGGRPACIGHADVDTACVLHRFVNETRDVGVVGYVSPEPFHFGASFIVDLRGSFRGMPFVARTKKDARAFARQLTRTSKANAAASGGDKSNAIL